MPLCGDVFYLVDRTTYKAWTMCHLIFSTACVKYFAALEYVSSGHVSKFPFFIALIRVDFTGNSDAACMYRTSASTLDRSYALYAEEFVCIFGVCCFINSSVGFRANYHSLGSFFSLQPIRIGLPSGEKSLTYF